MSTYAIVNKGSYEYLLNGASQVGVLVSKSPYLFPWSTFFNENDTRYKISMFYPPLILFLTRGGSIESLIDEETIYFRECLSEKGKNLLKDLPIKYICTIVPLLRDVKVEWVDLYSKFKIIHTDFGEEILYF